MNRRAGVAVKLCSTLAWQNELRPFRRNSGQAWSRSNLTQTLHRFDSLCTSPRIVDAQLGA